MSLWRESGKEAGKECCVNIVPTDQEASGAQGNSYSSFFLIYTSPYPVSAPQMAVRSLTFNRKVLFLS